MSSIGGHEEVTNAIGDIEGIDKPAPGRAGTSDVIVTKDIVMTSFPKNSKMSTTTKTQNQSPIKMISIP